MSPLPTATLTLPEGRMPRLARAVPSSLRLGLLAVALTGCDIGGKTTVQRGYRGTGMEYTVDNSDHNAAVAATVIPAPLPPAPPPSAGPLPWQNVQVLNDVSVAEFTRTMTAMATWVAGGPANCTYCHVQGNFATDTSANGKPIYTKLVARRMLQMTRRINGEYVQHVANTGVTCYTCHRGKPLPGGLWFYGKQTDYLRHYLDRDGARVVSHTVAPGDGNRSSVKQTEWTYALMISQANALGVGCTYCHNSRQFASWEQSPPQRVKAYHGILMLRDLNVHYLAPLQPVYPASRLGHMGDAPKAQCITCHGGAYKPLYAAQMAKHYPALWGRPSWNGVPFPAIPSDTGTAATASAAPAAPAPAATPSGAAAALPVGPPHQRATGAPEPR